MENPRDEIAAAVKLLTTAETPEIQLAAIEKYFAPDAGFNHPICKVKRGPNSRNQILGIYQWYRTMSPRLELDIEDVAYNESSGKVYLNITQKFRIFASPFSPAPAKLLVQLTLTRSHISGLYVIAQQDDFYQLEEVTNLVFPPITALVIRAKQLGTFFSNLNTFVFQLFGFWRPIQTAGMNKSKTS